MIPTTQKLKSLMTSDIFTHIALNREDYFKIAEEYVHLNIKFTPKDIFSTISLWADMIISPLVTILMAILNKELPSIFSMLSLHKTLSIWYEWIQYQNMKAKIHKWTRIVKSVGGPFVSTNDPTYHVYVYADAMQRIYACSFLPKN